MMLGDLRVDQLAPVGFELRQRPLFLSPHQATVTGHLSGQDGGKPTLYALGVDNVALRSRSTHR